VRYFHPGTPQRRRLMGWTALLGGLLLVPASAKPITIGPWSGSPSALPDQGSEQYSLTVPEDVSETLPPNPNINQLSVTIAMDHTKVGKLTMSLIGPGGDSVILMDQPNKGDSLSNLSSDHPITFSDAASTPAYDVGEAARDAYTGSDYWNAVVGREGPSEFRPALYNNPFGPPSPPPQNLSVFDGDPTGQWTLEIQDNISDGTAGSVESWQITALVPSPSSLVCGLGLMVAILGRRQRT
jgi:subtilisin-like proprotein convertase family protein